MGRLAAVVKRPEWRRLTQLLTIADKRQVFDLLGYEPHAGQLPVHESSARFKVVNNGRRFGKTTLAAAEVVVVAVLGGHAAVVAPTYDLADICWTFAADMLMASPLRELVRGMARAKGGQRLSLATGGLITARSADNPKSLIGRGLDYIVGDEWAQLEDPEVFHQYIRPSLSDRQGGMTFISTPRGDNQFKEFYDRGANHEVGWQSWTKPTSANPRIAKSEIEEARRSMPWATFQQEYLAVFLDSAGTVFRGYAVCARGEWQERPIPGHRYVLGVDIAQYEDWTVIAVFDQTVQAFVHFIRFNEIDYPLQERMIAEASREWNCAPVLIDATNNQSVAQHVRDAVNWSTVEPFTFAQQSKAAIINQLAIAFEQREATLPARDALSPDPGDLPKLALSELGSFRYERSPSGNLKMNAPSGKHDDIVAACCLAFELNLRNSGAAPFVVANPNQRTPVPSIVGRFAPTRRS